MQPHSITSPVEIWKPVLGYEGWYEVSNLARVRRILNLPRHPIRRDGIRRPGRGTSGYLYVPLCRNGQCRNFLIHRLVLEAFTGPFAPGEQTNHINGIKTDNRLVNLEKVTQTQNMKHAVAKGLCKPNRRGQPALRGECSPNAKLTATNVQTIRALAGQVRVVDLAERYGVSTGTIYSIWKRRNWAHLA